MRWIERCWYSGNKGYLLLLPLSWLYWVVIRLRAWAYRTGMKQSYRVNVPVIIVGNITVGGTGKTPFTLWLCDYLQQQGLRPGIISRGYGAEVSAPKQVDAGAAASEVGDEPLLLAQRSGCPVVVCRNRVAAAEYLLAHNQADIIISDDGLQHYRLQRALEIVLVDGTRGFGNGWLLPAGPLREPASRLKRVDIMVSNTEPFAGAHGLMALKPGKALSLSGDEQLLPPAEVTLVAGIGNPERFRRTALQAGFQIKDCYFFADHHRFSAAELSHIEGPVLMTEKDAVKCRAFARHNWFSLTVDAQISDDIKQLLTEKLNFIRSHYGT
ncbi:tetraacyldisaccharide 4'-kinase [Chromatiaceae bacterium AAb-1]|nr:tetraacyldisaccharide 4'-kinase [Chromatiaceae bacterium AAb-1]